MAQRFVGRPLPRFEDRRLLCGAGRYTDDFSFPDQAHAAFVRSPHAHARVLRIDAERARLAPGVLAVLTADDYLADGCVGVPHPAAPTDAVQFQAPAFHYADPRGPLVEPQLPLASDRVRFVGEAVAVVIADAPARARDAAELVDVEYELLPAVADVLEALAPHAPLIWPDAPGNVALDGEHGDRGATESALAEAGVVIEHAFRVQRIANAQLEPRSAIGVYQPGDDSYLLVAGTQGVSRQHATLAAALRVAPERLRLVCPDVGGGFGPRSRVYAEQVVVTWAAKRLGRPVRWTSDRSEGFLTDYQGRDSLTVARVGLDTNGGIRAVAVDCLFNVGAHTIGAYVPMANFSRIVSSVYDVPHAYVRMRGVLTNTGATGPFRGAGRPEAMLVMERLLDLAAARLGTDRIELRRRNLIPRQRLPYQTSLGLTYDSGAFLENMTEALRLAEWESFPERRTAAAARGRYAGIGLANYVEAPVGAPHERVKASVRPDGIVELFAGTQSTGQGHETSYAQVAADELGVTPERVRLITGDTAVVRSGGGTHSDRSMRLAGTLIVQACGRIRERCRELASDLLEVAPDDLVHSPDDGSWSAAGTGRRVSLVELARVADRDGGLSAEAAFTGRIPAHPTGTAICELEVDPETGAIDITRYTAVDDVGQPINPLIVEGQVAGGIAQGIGQALCERVVYEPGSAQLITGSFMDYAIPEAEQLPSFTLALTEDATAGNPLRVKGGGEAGITPCMAAVANAVADALSPVGVSDVELPMTSSRVWSSLTGGATSGRLVRLPGGLKFPVEDTNGETD
jgi:carbon-monoxide dehydrogenase large subunit